MTKAALYVRVSTDKQEADNQLIQLREYINNKGYTLYKTYVDVISGKEKSRPSFDLMFNEAHQLKFQVVVFWDLSRFSRAGTLYTLQRLEELDRLGVQWHSYQEPYFSSAGDFKNVVISILATIAKIEREKISERTKAGLERVKRRGTKLGRPSGAKDRKPRKKAGYYNRKKRFSKKTAKSFWREK
tara:strand:+ start:8123 stop:8680 length:558 start_codon:yes stop_codon:yes gene_type:complete